MPHADPEAKRAYDREYGNARRGARSERTKRWREANPERQREHSRRHHLRRKFGLELEEYEAMLEAQGGGCAICASPDPSPWEYLCVDHDHETGVVRGLLCHRCNVCIGQAGDDPETLRKAAAYLEGS